MRYALAALACFAAAVGAAMGTYVTLLIGAVAAPLALGAVLMCGVVGCVYCINRAAEGV